MFSLDCRQSVSLETGIQQADGLLCSEFAHSHNPGAMWSLLRELGMFSKRGRGTGLCLCVGIQANNCSKNFLLGLKFPGSFFMRSSRSLGPKSMEY